MFIVLTAAITEKSNMTNKFFYKSCQAKAFDTQVRGIQTVMYFLRVINGNMYFSALLISMADHDKTKLFDADNVTYHRDRDKHNNF